MDAYKNQVLEHGTIFAALLARGGAALYLDQTVSYASWPIVRGDDGGSGNRGRPQRGIQFDQVSTCGTIADVVFHAGVGPRRSRDRADPPELAAVAEANLFRLQTVDRLKYDRAVSKAHLPPSGAERNVSAMSRAVLRLRHRSDRHKTGVS